MGDEACTRCGATPETGQGEDCPECQGVVGPINDGLPLSQRRTASVAQDQRDPFADDVLERLIRSNQDYQREHGNYIVPLSERLLAERADNARLREEIRIREESQIPVIPHGAAVQLERLQVEVERLRAWHDKTVPVIAALAIYGEGASLPALVEKARALNEAHRG